MATYTTISKNKVSWVAPPPASVGDPEVDFLFSDGTDFLFSDGTDFLFKEATSARAETDWTPISKTR